MGVLCPGCGAEVPASDGPTHAYIGASPGCWAMYGEVLAREYGEFRYPEVHRLTVDAYAAQHPGVPSRRSVQSVAVHLIGLCLTLEQQFDARATTASLRAAVDRGGFVWLPPPERLGEMTIRDVIGAADLSDHAQRVEKWAASVWSAWSMHAALIREWAADCTKARRNRRGA